MKYKIICYLVLISCINSFAQVPEGFVDVKDVIPSIKVELRYYGTHNFVGSSIDGYDSEVVILTKEATFALKKIQKLLLKQQLSLKIYDAYRPQKAVNHFWRWAKNVNDTLMKQEFYPSVEKKNLFKEQYIATRSRHSSGSTIDITLIDLNTCKELDMGTPYDFFGKESWVSYDCISKKQKKNRKLLQEIMLTNGFRNYSKEWWHFTLRGEPYRDQYFDFVP